MSEKARRLADEQRRKAWGDRIPTAYRDRRLEQFSPAVQVYAEKLLGGETWCLYLFGGVGSGKTSFAVAVMYEWFETRHGWPVLVTAERMAMVLRDFDLAPHQVLGWKHAPLLVLDDIGANRATEYVRDELSGIISHRYDHRRPTIVTANLSLEELGKQWDKGDFARLASRLNEGVYVNFGAKDRRKDRK